MSRFRNVGLIVACLLAITEIELGSSVQNSSLEALHTDNFSVIQANDGTYEIRTATATLFRARVAAQIDHKWVSSSDYPKHEASRSAFEDGLGRGQQITVTSSGLQNLPDLVCLFQIYEGTSYAVIQTEVRNHTDQTVSVQSIRSIEALGDKMVDLGPPKADRVLSDSFSEDWPPLQIYDLGKTPQGMHRAVGSQLIYNRQTKQSLFLGALTSSRFLTIFHLQAQLSPQGSPSVASFTVDSTGTTEIQATDPESGLRGGPAENLVELSTPLSPGASVASERVMLSAANDYHAQLETYAAVIRELHHARVNAENMLGWWSWTAYYTRITQGSALTNARWLADHLKTLGYDYFHFDLGYAYSRSEYATPNASQFPQGMWDLTHRICRLGLKIGVWTAPFEVGERAWIYEHHKDWLLHNGKGEPISIGEAEEVKGERLFVLDVTHPDAQEYLRLTYRTLVREWGVGYIKLDFMDNTAVEGFYHRPNTSALEAQRIGLDIIRQAVGGEVLLDKDGSPMLNPVGLVDEGRISQDTGHAFDRSKEAAPGIAARYYMHRNFFIDDPDAFTVSRQLLEERTIQAPLSLNDAQVSIALAAVSGGMFEIGDDLPTLGSEPERLALLKNPDLLAMAKIGVAATPVDLLDFAEKDGQPSIFLLRQDKRQAMLAVFNWTDKPTSHAFRLSDLKFPSGYTARAVDSFTQSPLSLDSGTLLIDNQPAHSVKLVKIVDTSVPVSAPSCTFNVPNRLKVGEEMQLVSALSKDSVPALSSHWDFGDGVTADGAILSHAYTTAGKYTVRFTADGLDGKTAEKMFSVVVDGDATLPRPRRYIEAPH